MDKVSIGRIVHYVLNEQTPGKFTERPAMIVETWGNTEVSDEKPGSVQLQIFLDGTNDLIGMHEAYSEPRTEEAKAGLMWRTSVEYHSDKRPGSWHWPERAPANQTAEAPKEEASASAQPA